MGAKESNLMENPTRRKIREAEYFLSTMKQAFEDDNAFPYNLSAFLSAARSITWHMQEQYKHRDGFKEWYQNQKKKCLKTQNFGTSEMLEMKMLKQNLYRLERLVKSS
jgi:hypothetical protein